VQGPMARSVADVALFLDTMAGWDPSDPLTYDAPGVSYGATVAASPPRLRIAYSADFNGALPVDRETRAICTAAVRRFEDAGCTIEEFAPDLADLQEAFLVLRSQHFVVDREIQLQTHRALLKPDIVWNTERGLAATPSRLAWAERERAAWYRRMAGMFSRFDVFVTPGTATPAFDVMLRHPESVAGVKLENYMAASMLNAAITLAGCPAVAVPCGLDQHGRPVGLQIAAPPRREDVALRAAALFERVSGVDRRLPIDPKPGTVPPVEA
jgi:amidase